MGQKDVRTGHTIGYVVKNVNNFRIGRIYYIAEIAVIGEQGLDMSAGNGVEIFAAISDKAIP